MRIDDSKGIDGFARLGYAARGGVYLAVGALAGIAAWNGTRPEGTKGALKSLNDGALGPALIGAIAIGLLCFAAWRWMQALLDRDGHGTDARGLVVRFGLLVSGFGYAAMGLFAGGFLLGAGGDGGSSSQKAAAWVMGQPFGRVLLGLVAVWIAGVGLAHIWKAYKKTYLGHFDMDERVERFASPVCRFGLAMRGIVFVIIAGLFVTAAIRGRSDDAGGLSEALKGIQDQPYGPWLLGFVAVGLAAFGLYSLIEVAWRRVNVLKDTGG